eukprot:jgi/Picre1/32846/NNA_008175.t1
MDFSSRRGEAQSLVKEANKLANPSFLGMRMKGDWLGATPLYERAALLFRQTGDVESAKECWEKAAQGHKAQRSPWHAAKALERAADLAREAGHFSEIETLYSNCAELYVEEGRPQAAAEAISRGAVALSDANPDVASSLHFKAIEWLEESDKESTFPDIYRQAIMHAVKSKKWVDAVKIELKFASSYTCTQKMERGRGKYQDALGVPEFASSDQAFAAEDVIAAYRSKSKESIESAISRHASFKFLDNCIARLVKNLTKTDVAKTAEGLGGGAVDLGSLTLHDDDEEDLT